MSVSLFVGSHPGFASETGNLLRARLFLVALILCATYLAFLVKGLILPSRLSSSNHLTQWILVSAMMISGAAAVHLRSSRRFDPTHLRLVELAMFSSSSLLYLAWGYRSLIYSAGHGYLWNVAVPWLILIFTYALFIPNSWRRAAWLIVPMSLGPFFTIVLAWTQSPVIAAVMGDSDDFRHFFIESLLVGAITASIAIVGVRTIRALRFQAFRARQLGQYRLKHLLGRGGMGEVYLAEHLLLKRPCALKLIRPEMAGDPACLARFEQEVQATSQLTHWNTIEIFDFGRTDDGTFYYVMEYLPGMSLDRIVASSGPLPPERVVHLLVQTCAALNEAHGRGLIHRDLKPANIFAAIRGGVHDVAKLLDFGLVRSLIPGDDPHLTREGMVTGTPHYMSPEQARGDAVDGRSDIYSLGCVSYFLLTGQPPFHGLQSMKLTLAHIEQEVTPPSQLNTQVPADIEQVVLKCLKKSPAERYQSVVELRAALLACDCHATWNSDLARDWWDSKGSQQKKRLDAFIEESGVDFSMSGLTPADAAATTAAIRREANSAPTRIS